MLSPASMGLLLSHPMLFHIRLLVALIRKVCEASVYVPGPLLGVGQYFLIRESVGLVICVLPLMYKPYFSDCRVSWAA